MKTKISLVILAVFIVGAGIIMLANRGGSQPNTDSNTIVPTKPSNPSAASNAPKSYTLAQVAQHNSSSSCWSAINGKVYDLTSWIGQHPGGQQAILIICGKDGSSAFNDQHGGQSRPVNELAGFAIGALAQ